MMRRFLYWLTDKLPAREIRGDKGEPYLERYYLGCLFGITFYVHRFVASDPDRGLHDHPWPRSVSLILCGHYYETRRSGVGAPVRVTFKRAPSINVIRGTDFHRVILPPPSREVWTIFAHGKRTKKWGFLQPIEHDCTGRPYMVWLQYMYDDGDDAAAGIWWTRCPNGRELRSERK